MFSNIFEISKLFQIFFSSKQNQTENAHITSFQLTETGSDT